MIDTNWERRTFLKALLTLSVSQSGLWLLEARRTLAAPTQGKLALLVGINDYGEYKALKGCETDVELQRDLLIHRFGFQSADILLLTGKQATRENIETAFVEHLQAQAKPSDVVVFHFSGYGTGVKVFPSIAPLKEESVKGFVPQDGATNVLLEETLRLLGRSLATDKITMVFDTSHGKTLEGHQGNYRGRSYPQLTEHPHPKEIALQEQLRRQIKASASSAKSEGMILTAAGKNQVAAEIPGNGFSAGLFTYSLTQYLWQVMGASKVIVTLKRVSEKIMPIMGKYQEPQGSNDSKKPMLTYSLLPETPFGAEGMITGILDSTTAELKLTGLPLTVIESYGINSCFSLIPGAQQPPTSPTSLLQLRSLNGLTAKARLLTTIETPMQVGQLIQEAIRVLPRNLRLIVALANQLERIERVDATSAFSSIPTVAAVIGAGEQTADCVLGRIEKTSLTEMIPEATPETPEIRATYGLFSVGGVLWHNTVGSTSEAIKSAVERLTPYFQELLAVKLWRLTLNEGSSRLAVRVTLERLDKTPQPLIQRYTRGQGGLTPLATTEIATPGVPTLARGSQIQYRLENFSDRPLYFLLLGRDAGGKTLVFYPAPSPDSNASLIAPKETRLVPSVSDALTWIVSEARGLTQMQVICSVAPFSQTLEAIAKRCCQQITAQESVTPNKADILTLHNPLEVAQALLQDLHQASAVSREILTIPTDSYALDVNACATLNFVYQIV